MRRLAAVATAALLTLVAGLISLAIGLPTRRGDELSNPVLEDLLAALSKGGSAGGPSASGDPAAPDAPADPAAPAAPGDPSGSDDSSHPDIQGR